MRPPPVYPRVCGGTDLWLVSAWEGRGLSPRVRGNLGSPDVSDDLDTLTGLSPRVRGNHGFSLDLRELSYLTVYPRVCGGTACLA